MGPHRWLGGSIATCRPERDRGWRARVRVESWPFAGRWDEGGGDDRNETDEPVVDRAQAAARRKLIPSNPMEFVEWRNPLAVNRLDIATVPSATGVAALVEMVASAGGDARYAAMLELMGMAGLRPSEVAGLQPGDLRLPATGWGLVRLGRATASPGERYTDVDGPFETKELKHRAIGDIREVPLPPRTVARLLEHMEQFPTVDGRVFANSLGRPVASASYSRVFKRLSR